MFWLLPGGAECGTCRPDVRPSSSACVFSWQGAVGCSIWQQLPTAGPRAPWPPVLSIAHVHAPTHTLLPQDQGRRRPDDEATGFTLRRGGKVVSSHSVVLASCAPSQGLCGRAGPITRNGQEGTQPQTHTQARNTATSRPLPLGVSLHVPSLRDGR